MREEVADRCRDLPGMGFEREVACVEEMNYGIGNIAPERLGAARQEKRIVPAPRCQKWRLMLAKIGLEFGVQRDVALIVAEKVELHLIGTRSCEIEIVERVPVRSNRGCVGDALGVLPDRCL